MALRPIYALVASTLVFGTTVAWGQAGGQAASPAAAVDARKAAYRGMAASFKQVTDQLRSSDPELPAIRAGALAIGKFTASQTKLFPKGSGPESGLPTRTKAEAWTDAAGFAKAQAGFTAAAAQLSRAAVGGNIEQIQSAHLLVGQQCAACHAKYRAK